MRPTRRASRQAGERFVRVWAHEPIDAAADRVTDACGYRRTILIDLMTTGSIGISVAGSVARRAIRRTTFSPPTTRPSTA